MFALGNVEKFLKDFPTLVGTDNDAILSRAKACAEHGLIEGNAIADVFGSISLAALFCLAIRTDPDHEEITQATLESDGLL